jgi:hypothetical protein
MTRFARTDANQSAITTALQSVGAGVRVVEREPYDLVVGFRQRTYLLEVKDGSKKPSARKLTENQVRFHASWPGHVCIVESIDDALRAIGAVK